MSNISDGGKIAAYMKEASSNLRNEGRKAIYAIIASAWAISFSEGKFTPTCDVLWSLGLAISYVFLELLYYLISSSFYKYLLTKNFVTTKDGDYKYKETSKGITKTTKFWMHVGQIWVFVLSLILLASFICMLIAIFSLSGQQSS